MSRRTDAHAPVWVRSADQPAGAPDDGLGLDEVWGYGFTLPYPAGGTYDLGGGNSLDLRNRRGDV